MSAARALEWDPTEIDRDELLFDRMRTLDDLVFSFEREKIILYSDILEIDDVYEPVALEVDEVAQAEAVKANKWQFGVTEGLFIAILIAICGGFLYLNSSINDTRKELQDALNLKASEQLLMQVSREAGESRRHFDAQFKSIQAQIKADGELTRDKLENFQRTIGRLESKE